MSELYQQLERDWAEWNELDPEGMVCCASGSAALHLSLEAMRLPQGSECIVPDLTMIAVPRAVTLAGLTPVFVDCNDTLNMNPDLFDSATEHMDDFPTVIAVHTYGKRCDMDKLVNKMCFVDMPLVEDLAEAHSVKPHPTTNAACYSFYKNKIVSGEEGGAVWFRDKEHAKLARQLRSLGFTDAHDFTHIPRGMNYRMSNAHASLILDSLRRVDLSLENRWLQWHTYNELCPKEWRMPKPDAPWVFCLHIRGMPIEQQNTIVKELHAHGIAARHCFKSCKQQEEYANCRRVKGALSRAEMYSTEVVYLPLSSHHTRCHLDAFDVIQRILG